MLGKHSCSITNENVIIILDRKRYCNISSDPWSILMKSHSLEHWMILLFRWIIMFSISSEQHCESGQCHLHHPETPGGAETTAGLRRGWSSSWNTLAHFFTFLLLGLIPSICKSFIYLQKILKGSTCHYSPASVANIRCVTPSVTQYLHQSTICSVENVELSWMMNEFKFERGYSEKANFRETHQVSKGKYGLRIKLLSCLSRTLKIYNRH